MTGFRIFLVTALIVLTVYTGYAIARDGWNLFSYFFGDIARVGWPGQFNSDFTILLIVSGLWTAWRNRFSAAGIGMGLVAALLGSVFLTSYLLYLSWREGGDLPRILVGDRIASAR